MKTRCIYTPSILSSPTNHANCLFFRRWRFRRGSEHALLSDLGALVEEPNRHRNQYESDAAKQGGGILNTHSLEHLLREKREDGAEDTSKERVCGDCRGSELCGVSKILNAVNKWVVLTIR